MKIYCQLSDNDCAYGLIKTFYWYFYNKEIDPTLLPNIVQKNGITIRELEVIANKLNLYIKSYSCSYTEFCKSNIKTPFVVVVKNEINNHYILVKYKDKNGLKINDFNNNERYATYDEFKDQFGEIIITVEKLKNNYKKINIAGIFEKINIIDLYSKNAKSIIFSMICWSLYLGTSIFILFYVLLLFQSTEKNANILIILSTFAVIIFNTIFNFGYNLFVNIMKKNIGLTLMKTFYYHVFYKKLMKNEKLSKINYLKYNQKYNFLIDYFSYIFYDYLFIIMINLSLLSIFLIYKLYLLCLFWFLIFTFATFIYIIASKIIYKKNNEIKKDEESIYNYYLKYSGKNKVSKNTIVNSFNKLTELDDEIQKSKFKFNILQLLINTLDKFISLIVFFIVVTTLFLLEIENNYLIITIILLTNFSLLSIKKIHQVINNYITYKNITK